MSRESRPKFLLQNHFPELTRMLNRAMNRELHASLTYLAMAAYFGRDGVGLRGFADFFASLAREKRRRAYRVVDYLSQRGARVAFRPVERPASLWWRRPLSVAEDALEIERWINAKLIGTHYRALVLHDPSVIAFLERHFLQSQMEAVRARAEMVTRLRRVGDKVGVVLFDQRLRGVDGETAPPKTKVAASAEVQQQENKQQQQGADMAKYDDSLRAGTPGVPSANVAEGPAQAQGVNQEQEETRPGLYL